MRSLRVVVALLAMLVIAPSTHAADAPLPGRIVFVKEGDLWVYDANGAHAFATGGTFAQPSWSPDGTTLAFVYRGTNFADIFNDRRPGSKPNPPDHVAVDHPRQQRLEPPPHVVT
jgi:hypothetical protein